MKPVAVFRHVDCEGPGHLAGFLAGREIPCELVCVDAGEPVPETADGFSGLVFMGGPMSVNDPLDWIRRELDLIGKALAADIPVLGHCLGGQLIARALGGRVVPNPVREIGWHRVEVRDHPAAGAWFGPETGSFECFHWHGERYTLPDGAVPLLGSRFCDNQAFVAGKALAMQCHIEMTPDMVRTWTERFSNRLEPSSESVQTAAQMLRNVDERCRTLNRIADRVYSRWVAELES